MQNQDQEILGIDKNSGFAIRVLVLSIPAGLIFFILGLSGILSVSLSVCSYICILMFNTVFLLPMSAEIQKIKKYIQQLSAGTSEDELLKDMTEKETKDLTDAINSMHKFWGDKIQMLETRTLSDAAVLDTLPEPLLMVNKSGVIIGANRAVRELFEKDVSKLKIEEILPDTTFQNTLNKIFANESRKEDLRLTLENIKNKPKFHINMTTLPWFAKGELVVVISFYDLRKMLRFEQMQQDFVANASHELRTPLTVISGFVETLQTTAKNDVKMQDKFLRVISEQVVYMTALIEDLLSLSKVEMSIDTPPTEKININPLIREIKTALSLNAKENNLKITTQLPHIPQITADDKQMQQVLQNVIGNAIKYATPGTEINIVTEKVDNIPPHPIYEVAEGEAVKVSVSNYGAHIAKEDLARLTERFYRLQEHKNKNIKGTGLGLSIVTQIIKRHRGNIEITSEDGLTTFALYLPVD